MRELKFRAYNHKSKKMYYNVCVDMYGNANDGTSFLTYDKENDGVMLYIGIKDGRNKKEIYEGDIVKFDSDYVSMDRIVRQALGVITWMYDRYVLVVKGQEQPYSISDETNEFYAYSEVVGNIYETPELLKTNN